MVMRPKRHATLKQIKCLENVQYACVKNIRLITLCILNTVLTHATCEVYLHVGRKRLIFLGPLVDGLDEILQHDS